MTPSDPITAIQSNLRSRATQIAGGIAGVSTVAVLAAAAVLPATGLALPPIVAWLSNIGGNCGAVRLRCPKATSLPERSGVMNELLRDAFRHSAWATKRLIAGCEAVSAEDLMRPALGLDSMLTTLSHLVIADARFVATLDGGRRPWLDEAETNSLQDLLVLAEETGERWQRFLQQPVDGERLVTLDAGAYETHATVVVVQALHHVSAHGEQICAGLTALGVAAPDVQPWALADETGRSRWLRPQE